MSTTSFEKIYDSFFSRVTDDMYVDSIMSEADTYKDLQNILINALPSFEFPRFNIFDYTLGQLDTVTPGVYDSDGNVVTPPVYSWTGGYFNCELTIEEINILSLAMMVEWFNRQLATIDNTRLKYSSSDFKFTSQANHMAKVKVLRDRYQQECFHLQRLYKRRKVVNGQIQSTMGNLVTTPNYGYNISTEE